MYKIIATLIIVVALSACASAPETESSSADFQAEIRWTAYGIPHVKAADWAGMGYGFAYATANDGVCVIAQDVCSALTSVSASFSSTTRALGPCRARQA